MNSPASKSVYEQEFNKLNISLKNPKADTCHKCDTLCMKEKVTKTETELNAVREEKEKHQNEADLHTDVYKRQT